MDLAEADDVTWGLVTAWTGEPESGRELSEILLRLSPVFGALAANLAMLAQWWPGRGLPEDALVLIEELAGHARLAQETASSPVLAGLARFLRS